VDRRAPLRNVEVGCAEGNQQHARAGVTLLKDHRHTH
jgi:hypothetical protein